ncbi:baeRF11 domain-containing protein [Gordonia crocea]|uniref:Uncharacterized protein n=1 Tax=Gordonia crocea TaxID=589162 RepID=A0A7I9UZZ3_9ACTN|nr:hypothetical protein [Gordonia crocea]GED98506.1 hypothetical protein nbrc107697_25450 [Gordonia crocea]
MARYEFPTTAELIEMGAPQENAVTVYLPATAAEHEVAKTTVKSSMDEAIRTLRERGANHALETAFRERSAEILADDCWHRLSRSLAIFSTAEKAEIFVVPNNLAHQLQVSKYFDLGQFVRAVAGPQDAYALTVSAHGWNVWHASADEVAHEFEIDAEGIGDVAEATNRATVRGRAAVRRLQGDEGNKVLLESYAKQVAETVGLALNRDDPTGQRPLFLFAADPLQDMVGHVGFGTREVVVVPGSPDELRADQIDEAIRSRLDGINAARASTTVNTIADGVGKGLVATDLVDIARAAVGGSVDTLVYDFTVDVLGRLHNDTGALEYSDDGYDLLSRIAIVVLANGGTVVPVRAADIDAEIWNGTAVARLRHPLSQ